MSKGNEVLSANEGSVYVNGILWTNIVKIDAKATAEFDDQNFVGDPKTYKRYKGYKVEGSMTTKKTDSRASLLLAEGIKTGIMPDVKIITKQGKTNGAAERVSLEDVTFTDLQLVNLESNTQIEEEMPFSASDFNYLDRIAMV